MRFFTTAGPVKCAMHYCIPPLERFDLQDMLMLIAQHKYFVLHAPRQVGKTSYLFALRDYLNQSGQHHCVYINVEIGQSAREDVRRAMRAILSTLASEERTTLEKDTVGRHWQEVLDRAGEDAALMEMLSLWAEASDKPIVLLIDEIDSLVGDTLIAVLRQLRAGYSWRPEKFPQSIILCGVRDVRDYRLRTADGKAVITGGSAFNVKSESLRMGDFTQDEVVALYQQHTDETGQSFQPEALALVWELTRGQPWIVNALAYETCFKIKAGRDRSVSITADMIRTAKENLILRRETHLDQLIDKLSEERVRRVIGPILAGVDNLDIVPPDDVSYVRDLGLIRTEGSMTIANPIYQEVIPRELVYTTQLSITHESAWYIADDGRLDMHKLLSAFQQFFHEHSEHWVERFDYKEAGPQLLLQAFLQRIVNSGGRIEREYGLGRKRTDLLVLWPYGEGQHMQRAVIELKILYRSLEHTLAEGMLQTWEYMDRCGSEEGHLVIFNRDPQCSWEDKIFVRNDTHDGHAITVWGM